MNLFRRKTTDIVLFEKLGKSSYIRNGVGFGFISDEYLYDNCFIEIGIGRVRSCRGDWGGVFDTATDSPLKIVIDKNYIIQKVTTHSFYNSKNSQETEKIAIKLSNTLKLGEKFIIKDEEFKTHINTILNFIPCKNHIGHDVFDSPHMLSHFTDPKEKEHYKFRNPNCIENAKCVVAKN